MNWPRSWHVNPATPQARTLTPPTGREWYRIRNAATGTAEIVLYDEVGWGGVTAAQFARDLAALDVSDISLRISSGGGEVFDGFAIYEALRRHPATVTTYVDSLAASIASVIAMAGDRRVISGTARFMVHEASGVCVGNAAEMKKLADLLGDLSSTIASVYAERAGGTVAEWRQRMKTETWFSAAEAVSAGLATEHAGAGDEPPPLSADMKAAADWTAAIAHLTGGKA